MAELGRNYPPVKTVRCVDCRLDLDPRMTVRAALCCPMFGKPRRGVERQCRSFVPIQQNYGHHKTRATPDDEGAEHG